MLLYPFAFHDDLVVPYYSSCPDVVGLFSGMGRPGQGWAFCLQANLFPGFGQTRNARTLSALVVLLSCLLVFRYTVRERIPVGESLCLAVLIYLSAPSVMLVYYLASAGQLYGNLSAIGGALIAQSVSFRLADQNRPAFAIGDAVRLVSSFALVTSAYFFYQLSGTLYLAVISITALGSMRSGRVRPGLRRFALLLVWGLLSMPLYGLFFMLQGRRVYWSTETFSLSRLIADFDIGKLIETLFSTPWGVFPRVLSPWSLIGGPFHLPEIFFGAPLLAGVVFFLFVSYRAAPRRGLTSVALAMACAAGAAGMLMLLYSPLI